LIAHWRGGRGAEDVLLWPCWNESYRASFMRAWQAQCADAKYHEHRLDGRYITLYAHFDAQHFASMSAGVMIYLMFIALMPRRMEGSERDCLIPKLQELVHDEMSFFLARYTQFTHSGIYGYLANLSIITTGWFQALAEIQHVTTIMEWWLDSDWIRVMPHGADRTQCFSHILASTYVSLSIPTLDLYGLWETWRTPSIRGRFHISHLLSAKKAASSCVSKELVPLQRHLPILLDLPPVPPHLLKYQNVTPPAAASTPAAQATSTRRFVKKGVNFGNLSSTSPPPASPASTLTETDGGWDPHQAEEEDTVRNILADPSNASIVSQAVSQLTALVAAASLGPADRTRTMRPSQHTASAEQTRPTSSAMRTQPPSYDRPRPPSDPPGEKPCYAEFVHGVCPHGHNCRYSHDPALIRAERFACMSRWKLGPKAAFSNFNVVMRAFPLESGPDDPDGYSEAARTEVYSYLEDTATNADDADSN